MYIKSGNDLDPALFPKALSKADVKRLELVEAVIASIGKHGLAGTTFATVGKHAKMKPAHVAYYFKDRDSLIHTAAKAVVLTAQQITMGFVIKARSPREQVKAMVLGAFEHLRRKPEQRFVIILVAAEATRDEGLLAISRHARATGFERLGQILAAEKKQDRARLVHAALTGFVIDAICRGLEGSELAAAEAEALKAIDLILDGA